MGQDKIRAKIAGIMDLATIPAVALQMTQVLKNSDVSVGKVTEAISRDQALTAKLLRLVNSSFYGFPRQITSLSQAVILLGFNTVRNAVLSVSILKAFSGDKGSKRLDVTWLWEHSAGTALAAKMLADYTGYERPDEAFVGGLLHDIGRVFLLQFLRPEAEKVLDLMAREDVPMREAEETVLGTDHAWIGYMMAQKWHFPPVLCSGIAYHHAPQGKGRERFFASLIHLADIICRAMDIGCAGDDSVPNVSPAAWRELSLSLSDIEILLPRVDKNLYQIEEFLAIWHS